VIVDAGGGDVGVAEPFLDLCDVGLVVERIGGRRGAQRMGANLDLFSILNRDQPFYRMNDDLRRGRQNGNMASGPRIIGS
jgi:hypothetical protein